MGSTTGSGDTTSPDPAVHGGHWDRYVAWCDDNGRDPFDDDAADEFDTLCDIAAAEAAIDEREWREMMT